MNYIDITQAPSGQFTYSVQVHDNFTNTADMGFDGCIFSSPDTMVSGRMVKILGWYDNEWGYSNRLVDLAAFIA